MWKLSLTIGLDAEGAKLRVNDPDFSKNLSLAFRNKFWWQDHDMLPTYNNAIDYESPPLGSNGRLVFLGSLQSLETRVTTLRSNTNLVASDVLQKPYDGNITNDWESAYNTVENIIWPEPPWKCPPPNEPFDFANPYDQTPQAVRDALWEGRQARQGVEKNQIIYMNTQGDESQWVYILTLLQKEFFYGHTICIRP